MKEWELQHAKKRFELLTETFRSGKAPEGSFWKITEDGIFSFITQIYFKNESEEAYFRATDSAPNQRMVPDAYSFLQDGDWHSKEIWAGGVSAATTRSRTHGGRCWQTT